MLEMTDGYRAAIVGDVRQMFVKAILEIIDPDITFEASSGSGISPWAKPDQVFNKVMAPDSQYSTLEPNRWLLNGAFWIIPEDPSELTGQVGHVGDVLSGEDGSFPEGAYAELKFANVSILQACSIYFADPELDGIGVDFRVDIMSGDTAVYSREFTENADRAVSLDGFTVYDPTAIRVCATKWSLPGRYLRVTQIIPGVYEEWTEDILTSLNIQMRGNFSCLALPYGVASLRMDNLDRRFEPRNKSGVFQSIEERQGIPIALGVKLEDGTTEWKRTGIFYQANGGWRTSDNSMTMQWDLVDIVGLVAQREFVSESDTLPSTLSGWLSAIVGQLGENFASMWHVDPDYADVSLTVSDASEIIGQKCGNILRWACMASGTWPRADAETGKLTAEPFWNQGNKYDLDNMTVYPTMKANDDLAVLTFKLHDGSGTICNISGNNTASSNTLTVNNPFIHTEAQALTAARQILSQYGGLRLELIGRGDPSSEIGDVDTVWLDESNATTGRRMEQSFGFYGGVLQNCRSVLLQADGSFMFEERVVITQSGQWTAPAGKTQLRCIIGSGGTGGTSGTNGSFEAAGEDGLDGAGGKILAITVNINEQQTFDVVIGEGGEAGADGTATSFGAYSSDDGKRYSPAYTDVASGDAFGRTGVTEPLDGTGDGGAAGRGGSRGVRHREQRFDMEGNPIGSVWVTDVQPGKATSGKRGAKGFVVVCWDKEE